MTQLPKVEALTFMLEVFNGVPSYTELNNDVVNPTPVDMLTCVEYLFLESFQESTFGEIIEKIILLKKVAPLTITKVLATCFVTGNGLTA
jgi:hypothetical protein